MELNKIIGYFLLVVGMIIIGLTLFESYHIFTDKVQAPLIFKTNVSQQKSNTNTVPQEQQLNAIIQKQISQLLPIDTMPKMLNLISWSILAGILILGGGQIASIGIKMIR